MDPLLLQFLRTTTEAGRRSPSQGTIEEARTQISSRPRPAGKSMHRTVDDAVHGNGRKVPLRIYTPALSAKGIIVYLHGGGWVMGSIDCFDAVARELAHWSEATVISVDYSLAPECPYPTALEDAIAAVEWAAARYPDQRIALAGDSAGGNLATVAARKLLLQGTVPIAAQALLYPVVDSNLSRNSYTRQEPVPTLLSAHDMSWFWNHYVRDETARRDPDISPLRSDELAILPPTVLVLAGHDPLLDEGQAYADALRDAGVSVDLHLYDTMCHGFVGLLGTVDQAQEAVRLVGQTLQRELTDAQLMRAGQP